MDFKHHRFEAAYKWWPPFYNYLFGQLIFEGGRKLSIDLLEIKPGEKILEVGVGTGLTFPLYPNYCQVTAVDLSEEMLKQAHALKDKLSLPNIEIQQMNASQLKFADNTYDKVLANLFISATSEPLKALAEMKRVCKPSGLIVLMNHFKSDDKLISQAETLFDPVAKKLGFTSTLEMQPLLDKAGLKIKRLEKINFLKMWTAVSTTFTKGSL